MSRRTGVRLQELASIIGWISLGMGFALTLAPLRSAALLGWGTRGRLARAIGAGGLIVGLGLLLGRRRSRWMLARAVLNAVLAATYARVLAGETPRQTRARGGLASMIGLTVFDYSLSRRLQEAETS